MNAPLYMLTLEHPRPFNDIKNIIIMSKICKTKFKRKKMIIKEKKIKKNIK